MQPLHILSMITKQDRMRPVRVLGMLLFTLLVLIVFVVVPHFAGASNQTDSVQEENERTTLAVNPPQGVPGTVFTFSASGFQASEAVAFWANDPLGQVYTGDTTSVNTDGMGMATWMWNAPADAMVGQWSMVAEGVQSQTQQVLLFEITASGVVEPAPVAPVDLPVTGEPNVVPSVGAPGTTFTFTAFGFQPSEAVAFWANDPLGQAYTGDTTSVNTDNTGIATWTWQAPPDAMIGQWSMVAEGVQSQVQHVILFEVQPGESVPNSPPPTTPDTPDIPDIPDMPDVPDESVPLSPAPTSGTVSPESGVPGTVFTFSASGFQSRERVSFWANDPDSQVSIDKKDTSVNADTQGNATWTWTAPYDAIDGQWSMVAEGIQSQSQRILLFSITQGTRTPSAQGTDVANPSVGGPGTRFTFYAGGFNSKEGVNMWLNDPSGVVYHDDDFSADADDLGQVVWDWRSPEMALTGQWSLVVEGAHSKVQRVILFTIGDGSPDPVEIEVPENAPDVSVSPTIGIPGTVFTFSAEGFHYNETVSFWVNDPAGFVYGDDTFTVRSDSEGLAQWTWQPPTGARSGVWAMVARGAITGQERTIFFALE